MFTPVGIRLSIKQTAGDFSSGINQDFEFHTNPNNDSHALCQIHFTYLHLCVTHTSTAEIITPGSLHAVKWEIVDFVCVVINFLLWQTSEGDQASHLFRPSKYEGSLKVHCGYLHLAVCKPHTISIYNICVCVCVIQEKFITTFSS